MHSSILHVQYVNSTYLQYAYLCIYIYVYTWWFDFTYADLAQAYVALGKTQHRMSILPESLDSLSQALSISKEHFGSDHPQVRIIMHIYVHMYI